MQLNLEQMGAQPTDLPKPKALVIDDEPDISKFIAKVTESCGFDVSVLNNSADFGITYANDIDLIILDLFMPQMDGVELIRFLAENHSTASIILASGSDNAILHSAEELAKAHGLHVVGTLNKPIRAKELKKVIYRFSPIGYEVMPAQGSDELPSIEELQNAIRDAGLSLSCQPQINMRSGKLSGVEMLVRWQHPVKGSIPPSYFVPLAENNMLIEPLTDYVLASALNRAGAWHKEGIDTRVSINMSPCSLTDVELPDKLCDMAIKHEVNPINIVIEITETAVANDIKPYLDILARLRLKGFKLSIDDFGTGYSSMGQLLNAPFNELKIDQSFVRHIQTDKESRIIVKSSIEMAHNLGLRVVAEGIESEADWNFLLEQGCDEGQGFWMAMPMPADKLGEWIHARG